MLGRQDAPNSGTARQCAITGRAVDENGWFTNHQILCPGHDAVAWVSYSGARVLAQSIGYFSPAEMSEANQENIALRAALDAAVAEISDLRKQVAGVEGLVQAGFEVSKKTGRPPKNTEQPEIRKELEKASKEKVSA
jgi:hypothetical protein